jgi:hypothetical protein
VFVRPPGLVAAAATSSYLKIRSHIVLVSVLPCKPELQCWQHPSLLATLSVAPTWRQARVSLTEER